VSFRDIFSLWCISLSFMFTIPQAYRVVRRNTVEGISVSSQLQNLSGSILWVVYGFAAETYLVVLANVMTICGFGVVVLKQIQLGAVTFRKAFVVEACVIALAVSALVISQDILGVAARTSHLVGVSVVTFAMVATMSVSWGIYGLMIDDWFVALPNVGIVPSSLFVMFRAIQSHRRYGNTTVATEVPAR